MKVHLCHDTTADHRTPVVRAPRQEAICSYSAQTPGAVYVTRERDHVTCERCLKIAGIPHKIVGIR